MSVCARRVLSSYLFFLGFVQYSSLTLSQSPSPKSCPFQNKLLSTVYFSIITKTLFHISPFQFIDFFPPPSNLVIFYIPSPILHHTRPMMTPPTHSHNYIYTYIYTHVHMYTYVQPAGTGSLSLSLSLSLSHRHSAVARVKSQTWESNI